MEHAEPNATAIDGKSRNGTFIPEPSDKFVTTPAVEKVTDRSLAYLDARYPVHLTGVTGTGKTSLAFHIASHLDQPAVLLHGDSEFERSDLVGGEVGYRKSQVVDNFISSVLKKSENVRKVWQDKRLATACREGYTLIYDEFTRSRADTNNVLLSILEERILSLPARGKREKDYIRVHPNFRAIFTSNTREYAGTHDTQSALFDRLVTVELDHPDRQTEIQITQTRSGVGEDAAAKIVDLVRGVRARNENYHGPSVRAAILLGRVFADREDEFDPNSAFFLDVCADVLRPSRAAGETSDEGSMEEYIQTVIDEVFKPVQ